MSSSATPWRRAASRTSTQCHRTTKSLADRLHFPCDSESARRWWPATPWPTQPLGGLLHRLDRRGRATWSDPVNITDDDPSEGFNQYFPGISVAPDGRIDVAWHDFRNDPFFSPGAAGGMGSAVGERFWDVYYASSTNGGASWSANARVTNPSIDGDVGVTFYNNDIRGPIGIASTANASYVTWPDARPTAAESQEAEDVYFSRVRYVAAPELAATSGESNELLWSLLGAAVALAVGGLALLLVSRKTASDGEPEKGPSY